MSKNDPLDILEETKIQLKKSQAYNWLENFFDEESMLEINGLAKENEKPVSVITAYGLVAGRPVYAFAQDIDNENGAVTKKHAKKIKNIYDLAAQNGVPIVAIYNSDGIKLEDKLEGMESLATLLAASNNLSGVVPQIAIIAKSCVGSAAVMAANADIVFATKEADYYLNPSDDNADVDIIFDNIESALLETKKILTLLPSNNLETSPIYDYASNKKVASSIDNVMETIVDIDSMAMLSLRQRESKIALGRVGGMACGLVNIKGKKIKDAAKLARFIRLCDSFTIPIISFVDAESFESLEGAAKLSHAYAEATTTKISIIVGKAYGSIFVATAGKSTGADAVFAWPNATILPISPKAAVPLMWEDKYKELKDPLKQREKLYDEYAETEGSAIQAAFDGHITDIIKPEQTKSVLVSTLDMLLSKRQTRLPKKHSNIVL